MLTASEALSQLLGSVSTIQDVETLPVSQANGRVLAQAQYACVTVPDTDNSAMDGYAFRYDDVADTASVLTITQRIPAGATVVPLGKGE
ncbi:MAG: molybdopterin molybdenumtransferase MoeA, partial [Oxalobacter sp.]|nr:molybdopterin molybdenumtransferase MoeA [Oxalobacter sp.]